MRKLIFCSSILVLVVLFGVATTAGGAGSKQQEEKISSMDRGRAQQMLDDIGSDLRKHYYDPAFHGVDLEAMLREYKQRIQNADTMNMALSHVAAALDTLQDSHTFFLPPAHAYHHSYEWKIQVVGERCYVTQVKPKSDAEAKGVKPGDEVVSINGYPPDRVNLRKIEYVFNILRPQPGLRVVLRDPTGSERQVDVMANMKAGQRVKDLTGEGIWDVIREGENKEHFMRARYVEVGDELMILKLPEFDFAPSEVEGMLGRARKHKAMVLDLRGNPGGSEETLKYLLGGMFENDVKIGNRVGRETKQEAVITKGRHNPFQGKLVVLLDSRSASAAELFARVIQLEKRGTVLGDQSSGSVMEAKHYSYTMGVDTVIPFGASITHADLIMSDGKSLEHTGVTPDEISLPTAADLASGHDPVLAHAAQILGVKLSPEDAGKMFPYEWPPE
jgi:C-terminal processing protease CtpA/Prc